MATFTEARLEPAERRVLDRLVELLREEYGPDLHGVWLYGSRARGEDTGPESDIDVMIVATRARQAWRVMSRLLDRAAEEVDAEPWAFSLHPYTPEELARARAIESFFIAEVDRDKIVLFGDETARMLDEGGEKAAVVSSPSRMRPRSEDFMEVSRRRMRAAALIAETGDLDSAVEPAYYAMVNAVRAALSEEDLYSRTHSGMWHLFHETFVLTGSFDPELHRTAASVQKPREDSAYEAVMVEDDKAREVVETAEHFVTAVEAMFE